MSQGKFPQRFKIAKVVPIYKGGDHDNCPNCNSLEWIRAERHIYGIIRHKQGLYNIYCK